MKSNISAFSASQYYEESKWRDLGSRYFNDNVLNSIVTVQTKPVFTTFSKIICWANDLQYAGDSNIPITLETLTKAIEKIQLIIAEYTPKDISTKKQTSQQTILNTLGTQCTLSKPFILLAGISGTGKSRFVRQQAAAQGNEKEFLQMVPVRPDWHEPSDLLGYVSRIGGATKFIVTDALRFMVKAWRAAGAEVITLPDGRAGWAGKPLDSINTYWLCLDEMNLAPVEQYFADYLSVIESRSWLYDGDAQGQDYLYCCEPILPASALQVVTDQNALARELGLDIDSPADQQLWDAFLQHGIPVPFNLVVAGTVNMDETTHGFSRKVIDRALTFDFGRFFPNDFANLWAGQPVPKILGFARYSHASPELLADCKEDSDGLKTISFLQAVNDVLRDTPFELAYRALNELLLAVICHSPADESALQAVWDDFMMCKVLPRIEGDDEKLSVSSDTVKAENLLDKLEQILEKQLTAIWSTNRPELLLESANPVPCRSKAKLIWMKERLERNSFTSFWP
ncbi:McrB family protein [Arsukibacterium perlucidum]|uniref:McrB family protein n=1 Tax=Arsukibacterium perlucidum TaxID=368811 RepID=UPI0012FA3242|nr:restriction endonuclease [Arsukibacterium perlucidum]